MSIPIKPFHPDGNCIADNGDEDDSEEPRTIGQGEIANLSADDEDVLVDNQPIMLPEQRQKIPKNTPPPQLTAPAPQQQTPEPSPQQQPWETHPLSE